MADVWATKNGLWSDVTVWNTGALPTTADDVYADGRIVYIDINTQVLSISNGTRPGGTVNGYFIGNNSVSLSADVLCRDGSGGTVRACLELLSADPSVFTVYGNVLASTASNGRAIRCASSGTLTVFGNVSGGVASGNAWGIDNQSTGTVNVIGDVRAVNVLNAGAILNGSTGTVNVTGNVFGSSTGANNRGINNSGAGSVNVLGNIFSGTGSGNNSIINSADGLVSIVGSVSGVGVVSVVNNSTGTINITGNIFGGSGVGTQNASTGAINITGNAFGGITTNAYGIHTTGTGTITILGNVYAGTGTTAYGAFNQNNGTIVITGSAFGSNIASIPGAFNNNTTSIMFISGSAIGGAGGSTAYGAFNNSTGILRVKRAVGNGWGLGYTGIFNSVPGVFSNVQGSQTFVEELELGPRGQWPTGGVIFFTPNPRATSMFETDTFQPYSLIQSNSADNLLPPVSSVRQGTTYNLGNNTGTCIIPPVSSVAAGALVDNLTGTAVLTPQTTWNYPTTASDVNSMGGRLRNALNTNSANSLINSFNP